MRPSYSLTFKDEKKRGGGAFCDSEVSKEGKVEFLFKPILNFRYVDKLS